MHDKERGAPVAAPAEHCGLPLRDALDAFTDDELRARFYVLQVDPGAVALEASRLRWQAEERAEERERQERRDERFAERRERRGHGPLRAAPAPTIEERAQAAVRKRAEAEARAAYHGAFRASLASGELVARGRPGSVIAPVVSIEPSAWPHLTPNYRAGTALGPGVSLHDVQVAWPVAGLRWRNAVLACCEPGAVGELAALMALGYPRGPVGFLKPDRDEVKEARADVLWSAARGRLLDRIERGLLLATANDPRDGYARKPLPSNLGQLLAYGSVYLRAHSDPSLLEVHRHMLSGTDRADQCLLLSPNGQPIADVPEEELLIRSGLRVEPAPPVAQAPVAMPRAAATIPRPVVPAQPKRKRPGGADYREQDKPFIAEMHELIRTGQARNVLDAARAVAPRAGGQAVEAGKVDRLRKLYARTYTAAAVEPVEPAP